MKKTLVAVAALAASAAFAQSSVTLYGVADAYFGSEKIDGVTSQTVVNDGGLSTSRIGVSVKEDLGAGLSAFAIVESAVALDGGASNLPVGTLPAATNTNSASFGKSVVGLSGDFGAVSLGRQDTPLQDAWNNILDLQGNSGFSAATAALVGNAGAAGATLFNYNNSVRYDSPNFDGFSGAIQIGLGEDKDTPNPGSASRGVSLNLAYANGPLAAGLAYQNDKDQGSGAATTKTTALGGSYDFGPAKLGLGYTRISETGNPNFRLVNVGVTVPFGAFSVVGQFAQGKVSDVDGNSKSFALEGRYALSKRTTAYAGYNSTKDNIGGGADFKTNRFGVGIRHVF